MSSKKLSILTIIFLLFWTLQFTPPEFIYEHFVDKGHADITQLDGLTGQIGDEDVNWGTGLASDTFSVPTYSGGSATLTKLPALAANLASIIKGEWYVSSNSAIADHGNVLAVGSIAWVASIIGSDTCTVKLPAADYPILTSLTLAANLVLDPQPGAMIKPATGKTFTVGKLKEPGQWQWIDTTTGSLVFEKTALSSVQLAWFGPDNTGTIDATSKFLKAAQSLGASGGKVNFRGAYLLDNALTVPDNVFFIGDLVNPGQRKDAAYIPENFSSYIIVNPLITITLSNRSGFKNCLIINKDLSPLGTYGPMPFADAVEATAAVAAFSGTLFKPVVLTAAQGAVCDIALEDLLVLGFEYVFDGTGVGTGGLNMPFFRRVKFDCTNGIHVTKVYAEGRSEDLNAKAYTTTNQGFTTSALLLRTGTAYYTGAGSTWMKWDDCFEYGWAVGHDVDGVQQVRQVNCGADSPTGVAQSNIGFRYRGSLAGCIVVNPIATGQGGAGMELDATTQNNCLSIKVIGGNFLGNNAANGYVNIKSGNYSFIGSQFFDNAPVGHIKLDAGAGDGSIISPTFGNVGGNQPIFGDASAVARCRLSNADYTGTYTEQAKPTWVPVLDFGGVTTGITYSTQLGEYEIDNGVVRCWFRIVLTSKGAAAGIAHITGLPFTGNLGGGGAGGSASHYFLNMAGLTGPVLLSVGANTTSINLYDSGATGIAALSDANFANNTVLYGSFQYLAE